MWDLPVICSGKTQMKAKNWGDGIIVLNQSSETVTKQFGALCSSVGKPHFA